MKVFDQLLDIKAFREDKAQRAVHAQRRVLEEAVVARDDARHRLNEYRAWAAQQEINIYKGLCERVVRLRDIEDVHGEMQSLRQRQTVHEDRAKAAETHRGNEERRLESDRKTHAHARRMRDKFVELADVYTQEERDESERKEESEIEEAAEIRRPSAFAQEQIV